MGHPLNRRGLLLGGAASAATAALLAACDAPPRAIPGGFTDAAEVERGHAWRDRLARGTPAVPDAVRRVHTVVAGGGIAGLAAARALRQRGVHDIAVLELADAAGGTSRATVLDGTPCPLGAHYLPLPPDSAHEVQDLLEEQGLRRRVAGRWMVDERHRAHAPQERLFVDGAWQDGLLPWDGTGAATRAQYRRFAAAVAALQREMPFAIPAWRAPGLAAHRAVLDGQTFAQWLAAHRFDDPQLLWYLGYCCRDDYGAGIATVSAWAGIHYFASRHGFALPGEGDAAEDDAGVLAWPEGNGWLVHRLAAPLGERLHAGAAVLRIADGRHGAEVDALDTASGRVTRWQARQVVVALPPFAAARVVQPAPAWLAAMPGARDTAPWLVANLLLDTPPAPGPGAAPAWDNVVYGGDGLGYVNARHQALDPVAHTGPTVLTWYLALGDEPGGREALLQRPWTHWRDRALAALAVPHPGIADRVQRVALTRWGHGMAVPRPGVLGQIGLQAAPELPGQLSKSEQAGVRRAGRLLFAHAAWSGYAVFEEAFTRGHLAGLQAARG